MSTNTNNIPLLYSTGRDKRSELLCKQYKKANIYSDDAQHLFCEIDDILAFHIGFELNIPIYTGESTLWDRSDALNKRYRIDLSYIPLHYFHGNKVDKLYIHNNPINNVLNTYSLRLLIVSQKDLKLYKFVRSEEPLEINAKQQMIEKMKQLSIKGGNPFCCTRSINSSFELKKYLDDNKYDYIEKFTNVIEKNYHGILDGLNLNPLNNRNKTFGLSDEFKTKMKHILFDLKKKYKTMKSFKFLMIIRMHPFHCEHDSEVELRKISTYYNDLIKQTYDDGVVVQTDILCISTSVSVRNPWGDLPHNYEDINWEAERIPSYDNSSGGSKKTKRTRKHKAIHQSGGNKGRLKKGYRYSGKKTKSGLPVIVKSKSKKK